MQKLDKIQEVKVAEQIIEVDPRSKTTADQAFYYIALVDLKKKYKVKEQC